MPRQDYKTKIVVFTGGPGAGKTAVLELARKTFAYKDIAILPEAASILFGGGFWRKSSPSARKAAQRAIFHVQREFERMVLEERNVRLILCDRATLDGIAYWPSSEKNFFSEVKTTRRGELARYHMVIHLRTPNVENGYNHANPLRIETPGEANLLDQKILKAWRDHPNRHLIDSSVQFMEKTKKALALIEKLIEK